MKLFLLITIILFLGCSKPFDQRIIGIWKTNSKFYKATYKFEKVNKHIVGKLLYYNDGTTILHETGTDKDIFIKNLLYKDLLFIDALSGATQTNTLNYQIEVKHQDTLKVTTYIRRKPLIETWTRKQ
ncbi:hypothetical protein [Tenacibaculum mesophilum]|uniref:hypothetical protein n=1 Tax=Tenacibaculum mesophilum TaxID=104268 RepID=UPI00064AF3C8|nr:hypothetical protein [Tenacibaculum mesophilum]